MSASYTAIVFGGETLKITSITPVKEQKTRKHKVGKTLVEVKVIGMGAQQWELSVSGIVTGTTAANLSTNRAAVEALDDVTKYDFVDGIHKCQNVIMHRVLQREYPKEFPSYGRNR